MTEPCNLPDAQVPTLCDLAEWLAEGRDLYAFTTFDERDRLSADLKALLEQCERLRADVAELLSLDDSITHRLEMPHGWTDEAISAHRRDLDDRVILKHSLRAKCSPGSQGDNAA